MSCNALFLSETFGVSVLSRHQSCKGSTINQYISMQRNPAGPLWDPKLQYLVTRSFVRSKSEGTPLSADWSPLPLSTLLPTTRKSEVIGLMVSLSVIGQLRPILRSDWSKMSTSSSQPSTQHNWLPGLTVKFYKLFMKTFLRYYDD